jgi:hypothetical protein
VTALIVVAQLFQRFVEGVVVALAQGIAHHAFQLILAGAAAATVWRTGCHGTGQGHHLLHTQFVFVQALRGCVRLMLAPTCRFGETWVQGLSRTGPWARRFGRDLDGLAAVSGLRSMVICRRGVWLDSCLPRSMQR